jgi:signal transduction histidine kinase
MNIPVKLFWSDMQFASRAFLPVFFCVFIFQITGYWKKVKVLNVVLMMIVPAVTFVLVWFDPLLGLVRYGFEPVSGTHFAELQSNHGPWFLWYALYSYGVIIFSGAFLVKSFFSQEKIYRTQSFFLLTGVVIICIPHLFFSIRTGPAAAFDITPALFSFAGGVVFINISRYRLFSLVPVAREIVFEHMGESIIVTDTRQRILDINSRARELLELRDKNVIGTCMETVFPALFRSFLLPDRQQNSVSTIAVDTGRTPEHESVIKYYEVNCSSLTDRKGKKTAGCIYSINDVTAVHAAEENIRQQQQNLAVSKEQERVACDLHDNIGQILSFTSIQLQTIIRELNKGNTACAERYLKRLGEATDMAYRELREYIFNLRQPLLQNIPFRILLERFIGEARSGSDIQYGLDIPDNIPCFFDSPAVKSHLVSFTKEAVNNAVKYSGAACITAGLVCSGTRCEYYVQDDGKGFPAAISGGNGVYCSSGMQIMEERALLTGGRLFVASLPGKGTKLSIIYLYRGVNQSARVI